MRTERNSANSLRVNHDRIRELEKQVEAELRKVGSNTVSDKAAYRILLRAGNILQKINNETAKSFESGK